MVLKKGRGKENSNIKQYTTEEYIELLQKGNIDDLTRNRYEKLLNYCKKEKERLFEIFYVIISTIPQKVYRDADFRFEIGHHFSIFLDEWTGLKENLDVGYDMVFENGLRVSIKHQQELFGRPVLRGKGFTKPKEIALKNCRTTENKNTDITQILDCLLAVEGRRFNKGLVSIRFALASKDTVQKYVKDKANTDQLVVKIPDNEWEFDSGAREFKMEPNEKEMFRNWNNRYMDYHRSALLDNLELNLRHGEILKHLKISQKDEI